MKDVKPRWIGRRSAFADPVARVEREVAAHRAGLAHMEVLEKVADGRLRLPERTVELIRAGAMRLPPETRPAVADPEALIPQELARLSSGEAQLWTSPIRAELLARYLIEATEREDGRWAGDRITEKGRRALASGS